MIYFTSDLHLGHKNIIELANRPFSSLKEMDEILISNWNKKVKGNDVVYILGDLIYKSNDPEKYLKQLKGVKHLIIGNHDNGWLSKIDKTKYFKSISLMIEQSLNNRMTTLCHYPMLEWRASRKGLDCAKLGYLIYGHIHNRFEKHYTHLLLSPNALNAGVDVNNFEPVSFDQLVENNSKFKRSIFSETELEQIFCQNENLILK